MKKSSEDHWMSISDLMSALMIVFMLIAIAFMIKVQHQQKLMNDIIVEYAEVKANIYKELYDEFENDLPKWDAEIDKKTLSVRFKEPDILFSAGSSKLNPKFQSILNDFMPRYIKVLSQPKYANVIQEIRIEGHTSSEWYGQNGTDAAYFGNMVLSQERTRSVLEYTICMPALQNNKQWLMKKITANGLSFSQKIVEDGVENKSKSRRVEFRIRTNADEQMDQLEGKSK